jgi:hypothetical protein
MTSFARHGLPPVARSLILGIFLLGLGASNAVAGTHVERTGDTILVQSGPESDGISAEADVRDLSGGQACGTQCVVFAGLMKNRTLPRLNGE